MALPLAATAFAGAVTYVSGKIASDVVFKAVCWAFFIFVISIFVGFVTIVINAGISVYQIILELLNFIQSNSGNGSMLGNFYGLLNCSGALAGINATKGLVLSALVFRLLYFGFKHFVSFFTFAYHAFVDAIGARLT
jgi:hypothetical protein